MLKKIFKKKEPEKLFELSEEEMKEIQQFENVMNYKPDSSMTIVYLPGFDFNSEDSERDRLLLKALAEVGVNVIYMNNCYDYYQVDDIEYPYIELPNFQLVRVGTNCRHLYSGRVVYWTHDSRFYRSMTQSRAHLIVYDSIVQEKFPDWDRHVYEMEKIADYVIFQPLRVLWHGKYNKNIELIDTDEFADYQEIAKDLIDKLKNLRNRPPLLE